MKVKVEIAGTTSLLMHRFLVGEKEAIRRREEVPSHEEECEKAMYKNEEGCYIPSTWISATLVNAGSKVKKGKGSYKDLMKVIVVEPEEIALLNRSGERYSTYEEMFLAPAVVQRQRILRARPKFNGWQSEFNLDFDEKLVKPDDMKAILELAGRSIGIGDWRPKFGRFKVNKFELAE